MMQLSETFHRIIEDFALELGRQVGPDGIGGTSFAIIAEDEIIWQQSLGWANQERRLKASVETVYPIASLTKPFTALLLLQLCQEDLVKPIYPLCISTPKPNSGLSYCAISAKKEL